MHEAICNPVPMIAFPVFAEQDFNGERLQRTERGITLDITSITADKLEDALQRILKDDKYAFQQTLHFLYYRVIRILYLLVFFKTLNQVQKKRAPSVKEVYGQASKASRHCSLVGGICASAGRYQFHETNGIGFVMVSETVT